MNSSVRIIFALCISVVSSSLQAADLVEQVDVAKIDSIFASWSKSTTPGCVVGVMQDDNLALLRAYGMADLEHDVANNTSTLFEVGSISKQFTSMAILLLARDGKLALTDDIRKYLPEMPDYGKPITIDHLLTHTSGVRDWGFLDEVAGWGRATRVMSNADALDTIVRQKQLNFLPGEEYSYTNSGYVLLALIAERVSGQSLPAFSKEYIFDFLGMKSTQWRDDFRRIVKGRSVAYMKMERGYVQKMPFEDVYGDAGILTSVPDMLIWNAALTDRKFGSFVATEMERPAVLNSGQPSTYARGLHVRDRDGVEEISHGGGIGAYRAWLARFPERKISIAVACNAGDPVYAYGGDYFGYKVTDLFLGNHSQPAAAADVSGKEAPSSGLYPKTVTNMPVKVGLFTGNYYSDELGVTYLVAAEGANLVLRIDHRPDILIPLQVATDDTFIYDTRLGPETGRIRFDRDKAGAIDGFKLSWNYRVRNLQFVRRH